jgi:hypothetical protein
MEIGDTAGLETRLETQIVYVQVEDFAAVTGSTTANRWVPSWAFRVERRLQQ